MTDYRSVPIDSIIIDRPSRQRRELRNLESLKRSITEIGVINAPMVTDELLLIAGERRLTACRELGHSHITVAIREALPTTEQRQIELAENVDREELDWKDRCFAVSEYHSLAIAANPAHRQADTAAALNMGETVITRHISLAHELEQATPLIVSATAYSVALGIMDRMKERRQSAEKDKMKTLLAGNSIPTPPKKAILAEVMSGLAVPGVDTRDEEYDFEPATTSGPTPFRCTDFNQFATNYTGTPFNFLHCDFPYGVNADKHNGGAASSFGGYSDTADVYWNLLDSLGNAMDTLVSESAHMMFWYSMDYHAETVRRLTEFGWRVDPFPLVWYKSDNSGILPDPRRRARRNYETALHCTRGDRKIIQAVSNVSPHPNTKTIHMSEKPIGMLRHFYRMFVDDTTNMLDPTMGSGNSVVLAENLGAKARGLEFNKTFYETAREKYLANGYELGDKT